MRQSARFLCWPMWAGHSTCRPILMRSLVGVLCGLATVTSSAVMAEEVRGLGGLGPSPTGLASGAFSALEPVRLPVVRRAAASVPAQPAVVGPAAAWRPLSPAERERLLSIDADLFPHTRYAVPLLVPDTAVVTSRSPAPARAMSGPSVGVPWRIPGYAP